jgi:hypothetical protein
VKHLTFQDLKPRTVRALEIKNARPKIRPAQRIRLDGTLRHDASAGE